MGNVVVRGSGSFMTLEICIAMLVFIFSMRSFDTVLRRRFIYMCLALMVAITAFAADEYLATFTYSISMRYATKLVKVVAEGFVELEAVYVIDSKASSKRKIIYAIPLVVISLIMCTTRIHGLVFTIDSANKFVLGPLGFIVFLMGGIYAALVIHGFVIKDKDDNQKNTYIGIILLALIVISVVLEELGIFYNSIIGTAAITVMILYMYMYAERYNVDSVTRCYKRRCFYSDGAKFCKHAMAVVSMDLNNLKHINDNFGHSAGDIALQTFANICKDSITPKFTVYRTGGDEFMLLGLRASVEETNEVITTIKSKLEDTPYSCSFGLAMYRCGDDFDDIVIQADQAMYNDKNEYKLTHHTKREVSRSDASMGKNEKIKME